MPPEIAYQPPPTAPAVHVMLDWAVAGPASSTATAIVTSVIVARLIGDLPGSLGALQYSWRRTCRQAALVTRRRGRGSSRDGATCEARGVEQREIEGGLAFHQPLGDVASRRRRVLEAVAAETDGEEEALDAGSPADDRVIIGRQRPEPGPAPGHARLLDDGEARERLLHRLLHSGPVH